MIKASYEILQPVSGQSFLIRAFDGFAFDAPYHFHPEYELTFIVNGSGKRYTGSHMENFNTGDLVLLGPNLPHCWKLEPANDIQTKAAAIVIQFGSSFLGSDFFDIGEMQPIKRLFQKSACGVCFNGATSTAITENLLALTAEKNGFKQLMGLLQILQQLASSNEYNLLDRNMMIAERSLAEQERINPVFAYLVENFRRQVSLETVAGIANMTTNAFCKYFKKATRKTFMETVIEYRLNYALQQLVQTDKPISTISFESGFGDVSHFYKMFKVKMGVSPLNYRKRFINSLVSGQKRMSA